MQQVSPQLAHHSHKETLWSMLESEDVPQVTWYCDGRSLVVLDLEAVSANVMPLYFNTDRVDSFIRQLQLYG